MTKTLLIRAMPLALIALPLAACGSAETEEAEHSEEAEAPEGPHGGRMLTDGKLSVEVTIFEDGQEPQYRVYPYFDGKPLDPAKVNLQIVLRRLGGAGRPVPVHAATGLSGRQRRRRRTAQLRRRSGGSRQRQA